MRTRFRMLVGGLSAALALAWATEGLAGFIYSYTGNPFDEVAGEAIPGATHISGYIELSSLPTDSSTPEYIFPTRWFFTDGAVGISSAMGWTHGSSTTPTATISTT